MDHPWNWIDWDHLKSCYFCHGAIRCKPSMRAAYERPIPRRCRCQDSIRRSICFNMDGKQQNPIFCDIGRLDDGAELIRSPVAMDTTSSNRQLVWRWIQFESQSDMQGLFGVTLFFFTAGVFFFFVVFLRGVTTDYHIPLDCHLG